MNWKTKIATLSISWNFRLAENLERPQSQPVIFSRGNKTFEVDFFVWWVNIIWEVKYFGWSFGRIIVFVVQNKEVGKEISLGSITYGSKKFVGGLKFVLEETQRDLNVFKVILFWSQHFLIIFFFVGGRRPQSKKYKMRINVQRRKS